ncbi:MAG: glycosyltransferase family 39 protein, partial [Chloroflexota bacterium]
MRSSRRGPALRKNAAWLLPLFVGAAALALRLWQIDLTQFEDDQAALLSGAVRFVSTGHIPLTSGLSFTVGVRHPPLVTLLLTLPVLVTRNPIGAAAFTALCDALAAALVALTAARLRGPLAGISAGALYAVLPAALIYGRRIWNPDFVPFFSALALYAAVTFWQTRRPAWLATALVALACATQLHLAAGSLLVVWLAVALARWRDLRWQPLAVALGIILLMLSPYLYLQTQSRWSDFFGVVRFLGQPKHTDLMALDTAVTLAGSDLYRQLALPAGQAVAAFQHDATSWLLAALVLVGLGWAVRRREGAALIVAGWAVLPLLLSLRHTIAVEPHYLLCVLPAIAVLQGLAVRALRWVWLVGAAALAISGWQIAAYVNFQAFVARAGPGSSYGMPLRYELAAASAAHQANTAGGTIFIANADDGAGAFGYLLAGVAPTKRFDGQYTFVFPRGPVWYVSQGGQHAYAFLTSLAGPPSSTVRLAGGQPAFGVFHLGAGSQQEYQARLNSTPLDQLSVDHAVDLVSLSAPRLAAGHRSSVTLEWRVASCSAATGSELRQFGHLTDAAGRTWSTNTDFRGFPRSQWSTGDV